MSVPERSGQVDQVTLPQVRSGLGRLDRSDSQDRSG